MEDMRLILSRHGFSFKKQFGQNFITDSNLLASIVDGAGATKESTVVEIGCGAGTLTRAVAERTKRVIAFEIDKDLRPVLAVTLAGAENAEVVFRDFMSVNMEEFERDMPPYMVIANLPYYITTPLVMKFIEGSKKCISLTVMVQEEVAERFCALPNTCEYGAVTAGIALRGVCKIIKRVPRTMFHPRPNVDSAVVRIDIARGRLGDVDGDMYKKAVQAAFGARRKTLENNLCRAFSLTREQAEGVLNECGIDLKARGETLSPEDFVKLSGEVARYINKA